MKTFIVPETNAYKVKLLYDTLLQLWQRNRLGITAADDVVRFISALFTRRCRLRLGTRSRAVPVWFQDVRSL